jgi:hypothetical protein
MPKTGKEEAMSKRSILLLLIALTATGCASPGRVAAGLKPGMSEQEVFAALGTPADRSFREGDEAWRYQELVGGQCKYTTVWLSNGKLVGISTRTANVASCAVGSKEIDWSQMPSGGGGLP